MAKDKKTANKTGKPVKKKPASVRKPTLDEVLTFAESDTAPANVAAPSSDSVKTASVKVQGIAASSLMPNSEKDKAVLKQRAAMLAGDVDEEQLAKHRETYLRLRLGKSEEYGIPYKYLEEILYVSGISGVPCTPPHIAGVVNRRGEMLTVLDLQPFFNIQRDDIAETSRIIVVSCHGMQAGILVDEVISDDHYDPEQLAPPIVSSGVTNLDYVSGIYKGKVTMLNLDALLSDPPITVNEVV
jgi:purine-binding chemotaxis protein CheW